MHGKASKSHSDAINHALGHFGGSFSANFYRKGQILPIVLQITATNRCRMMALKVQIEWGFLGDLCELCLSLLPRRRPLRQLRRLQNHGNDEVGVGRRSRLTG